MSAAHDELRRVQEIFASAGSRCDVGGVEQALELAVVCGLSLWDVTAMLYSSGCTTNGHEAMVRVFAHDNEAYLWRLGAWFEGVAYGGRYHLVELGESPSGWAWTKRQRPFFWPIPTHVVSHAEGRPGAGALGPGSVGDHPEAAGYAMAMIYRATRTPGEHRLAAEISYELLALRYPELVRGAA